MTPLPPTSFPSWDKRTRFYPEKTMLSRLPCKILQSPIVVVSECRKDKLKQHYSVTAAERFVRVHIERKRWPTFNGQSWSFADLHSRCRLYNSITYFHVGLAFARKGHCTNVHCSQMFICFLQASCILIGLLTYLFISQLAVNSRNLLFQLSQIILLDRLHCKE